MADVTDTTDQQLFLLLKKNLPTASDADIWKGVKQYRDENPGKPVGDIGAVSRMFDQAAQPAEPQTITVTGKRLPPPSERISAMPDAPKPEGMNPAAQQDAIFAGSGGTAARLAPTDPKAVAAAQAALYAKGGGDAGQSALRLGAVLQGFGGNHQAAADQLKQAREMDAANTVGLNKAQMEAGTTGINNANSVLSTGTQAGVAQGDLDMRRRQFVLDQQKRGVDVAQAQANWDAAAPFFDPTSHESDATKAYAAPFLHAMGMSPSMVNGMSGAQVTKMVELNQPAFESWAKKNGVDTSWYNAITSRITGSASANATNLGTKLLSTATNGGTSVPTGMNLSIGAGPASLSPSPATTGVQSGAADAVNSLRKQVTNWDTSGAGNASGIALKTLSVAGLKDTGVPGAYLSRITPTDAAAIKTALIGQVQSANPGMDPAAAEKSADTLMKTGTPARIAQQLASAKAQQMANKTVILPAQEAWLKTHGDLTGFVPPKHTKYWNPSTGQTAIATEGDKAPKGWLPISEAK